MFDLYIHCRCFVGASLFTVPCKRTQPGVRGSMIHSFLFIFLFFGGGGRREGFLLLSFGAGRERLRGLLGAFLTLNAIAATYRVVSDLFTYPYCMILLLAIRVDVMHNCGGWCGA